jgi:lysophospholipase L1-like esterase
VGSSESEDIPSQLMELSKRPVDTLAVSGLRTRDVTKMLKDTLPGHTKGYDGVVLIAGGNDVVFLSKTPISNLEEDFEELVREGLKHVTKKGKVFVLQPPDVISVPLFRSLRMTMTTSASMKLLSDMQERVVEKMRSEGLPVVLVSLKDRILNEKHFALDGMHLSPEGNSIVAGALFDKMKE